MTATSTDNWMTETLNNARAELAAWEARIVQAYPAAQADRWVIVTPECVMMLKQTPDAAGRSTVTPVKVRPDVIDGTLYARADAERIASACGAAYEAIMLCEVAGRRIKSLRSSIAKLEGVAKRMASRS
jgi:hypothetical protein